MNILKIILVTLLPLAVTWVTFKKRHLMLIEIGRASHRQLRMGFGLLLALQFSVAPGWYEMMTAPYWGRSIWFDLSPLLVTAAFIVELLLYRHLADQWKRSVPFRGAMLVPICGCILTILIWGHDRYQRSKYRDPAEPSATQSDSTSMRMVALRRRRRLAASVEEMVTLRGSSSRREEALISLNLEIRASWRKTVVAAEVTRLCCEVWSEVRASLRRLLQVGI